MEETLESISVEENSDTIPRTRKRPLEESTDSAEFKRKVQRRLEEATQIASRFEKNNFAPISRQPLIYNTTESIRKVSHVQKSAALVDQKSAAPVEVTAPIYCAPRAQENVPSLRMKNGTIVHVIPLYEPDELILSNNVKRPITFIELNAFNGIIKWINFRIIEKQFSKHTSGIYLWSNKVTLGKTLLCRLLSQVVETYWWVFGDNQWQQDYNRRLKYKLIIYNAMNGPLLPYKQVEDYGDRMPIAVTRRNQHVCSHIEACTPFIITSNHDVEQLGYKSHYVGMDPWLERMLVIHLGEAPLFPLIKKLEEHFGIAIPADDDDSRFENKFYF